MCARTWMKHCCIVCDSDISFWLITLILNTNCPLLCFSDDDTFLPIVPVNDSSESSIEVPSIHWNITGLYLIHCSYIHSFLLPFPHVYVRQYFLSSLLPLTCPHSFCVLLFAFCLSFFFFIFLCFFSLYSLSCFLFLLPSF